MNRILLHILFCFSTLYTAAQENYFRHYTTADGLPSSETYSSFQDKKGFIWIATDMGVSRFDGYTFTNYSTDNGLADNTVFKFYEDYAGRIWFYSFSGRLSYFYNDSIYGAGMPVNEKLRATISSGYLTGIYCDKTDTLWLGTINGLLRAIPHKIKGQTTWVELEQLNHKNTYLGNGSAYVTVEPAKEKYVTISTYSNNKQTGSSLINDSYPHLINAISNPDNSIVLIFSDSTYLLSPTGKITGSIRQSIIYSMLSEPDSTIWLGSRSQGVNLYRLANLRTPIRHLLGNLTVSGIMRDHENGYWFTTTEDGLFYLSSHKLTHYLTGSGQMPAAKITSLTAVSGSTWLTAHHNIYIIKGDSAPVEIKLGRTGYPNHFDIYYNNTFLYKPDEIWISTSTGVAIHNPSNGKFIGYVSMFDGEYGPEYDSRVLAADSRNHVWSLNLSTLRCIDATTKKVTKLIDIPARAQTICEDLEGNMLVGTINGMYCYKNDSLYYLGTTNPLFKNRFVDIKKRNNILVAATRGTGIYIFKKDTALHLTTSNGLTSNMCRSVYIDSQNTIWLTTNNGLNIITLLNNNKPHIQKLNVSDGLLSNDIDMVTLSGNYAYLYSKKGLTVFNPDSVLTNKLAPVVYITRLSIDNNPTAILAINTFSYATNFINISYIGITYKNNGKQLYKYQLEGYDTTWTYTANPFVQFTKLPPGDYRFIVKCINNSDLESTTPAVLTFTISTPFYKTWWFSVLLMCLITGTILSGSALYINRIRKREELKNETNLKIANLELQAFRAQMNPHFIFNCLNAIQDFIIKNDSASARRFLTSFAKLIRTTLNNSRRQNIALDEEIEFLKLYLGLEQMRFNNKFDYEIEITDDVKKYHIEVPSMILQPFVENAIRHGRIGNLDRQGKVLLSFNVIDNVLVCAVDDNGIGLNKSAKTEHQPGNKQAHALDIINDRIKTIAEINKSEIRYTIQDKSETNTTTSGTIVKLFIPIKHD